jgi:hypothetical protein
VKKHLRFEVKQDHIDRAKLLLQSSNKFPSRCCPVALALIDEGIDSPSVGCSTAIIDGRGFLFEEDTIRWVERFDNKQPVEPFVAEMTED